MRWRSRKLDPKPWPFPGPRVLIEDPEEAQSLQLTQSLRTAGYAVAICPGPADGGDRCPVAEHEPCALVEGADVVVCGLPQKQESGREVLDGLRLRYAGKPVVVSGSAAPSEVVEAVNRARRAQS